MEYYDHVYLPHAWETTWTNHYMKMVREELRTHEICAKFDFASGYSHDAFANMCCHRGRRTNMEVYVVDHSACVKDVTVNVKDETGPTTTIEQRNFTGNTRDVGELCLVVVVVAAAAAAVVVMALTGCPLSCNAPCRRVRCLL